MVPPPPGAIAQAKRDTRTSFTLSNPKDGWIPFALAVVCHILKGQRDRHERKPAVCRMGYQALTSGLDQADPSKQVWHRVFLPPTHQARIRTSRGNPVLRLRLVAVTLVLCNVWVWLHAGSVPLPRKGARALGLGWLRLQQVLLWLVVVVANQYFLLRGVIIPSDFRELGGDLRFVFNYLDCFGAPVLLTSGIFQVK